MLGGRRTDRFWGTDVLLGQTWHEFRKVTVFHACRTSRREIVFIKPSKFLASFLLTKKIKGIIITVRPKRKKCIMYCYDVCVSVWACVQCSWDVEVKLAGALWPLQALKETGCFLQPVTQWAGFNWDLPPIAKHWSLWARGNTLQPSVVPKPKIPRSAM